MLSRSVNQPAHILAEQESLLYRITTRIHQSLQLPEILQTTVTEVGALLGIDRVKIYRFYPDQHGEVIAEAIRDQRLPSLLGLHFPADDIPPHARELFLKARQRSIVDLSTQQIAWSTPCAESEATSEEEVDIRYRPVDPCHVEYLQAMGVQASIVVPILQDEELWGLLAAHHAEPRATSPAELEFLQLVVNQVTIAIAQSHLFSESQEQMHRERIANQIATILHSGSCDVALSAALELTVAALQGCGGRLYLLPNAPATNTEEHYCYGVQPILTQPIVGKQLEHYYLWQETLFSQSSDAAVDFRAIADLYQDPRCRTLTMLFQPTQIRGLLIVPLRYSQQLLGCLTLFRHEIETETLWAGKFDPDERQTLPRQSFDAWREYKTGQAHPWSKSDLQLVQAISRHLVLAIGQYQLQQQIQHLNVTLEQQVQQRTTELQQANLQLQDEIVERQQAEREQARLAAILEATSDLVGIADASGRNLYLNLAGQELLGIPEAEIDSFHVTSVVATSALTRFNEQVLPVVLQQGLWSGENLLLARDGREIPVSQVIIAHKTAAGEVELLSTIARDISDRKQAELALQTSEAQLREKAEVLEQTLHELQQTQAQLVQTEKMSSLGQLVAGVAHEINNPVNFIYGNLAHANQYTQDLLNLLKRYQHHYPVPHPEIQAEAEAIEIDFLAEDLPKLLASMKLGTDRIRQIVLALRNFSRMDEAEVKAVNLHEGIDSTLMILQNRLKEKSDRIGIQIIKEYGQLPLVECYAGQLNQVFMNILSNAIDALDEWDDQRSREEIQAAPSCITIHTEPLDQAVRISITDNGPGLSDTTRDRLFEPFFTTKPVGKGTGLGLSISYQVVVEKHGGQLECISTPGAGATFQITLPLVPQPSNVTVN